MDLTDTVAVVTGANRGLGRALLAELLERGTPKVYALARKPEAVAPDPRVVAVEFDLLDQRSIDGAAAQAADATLLINNASTAAFSSPLEADLSAVGNEMATNYGGLYRTVRAFVPVIEANGGGQIVNVLTLLSLASTPPMAGYSASKAAAHSLTQAVRPELADRGISVHGVYPGGIDTDLLAGIEAPKTPAAEVAAGVIDGLLAGEEDIFPDPNSKAMSEIWWSDPKAFERAFSGVGA